MDPRERWQALQAHLSEARRALNINDREAAEREVDAALAIDPEFAAARALKDRIGMREPPAHALPHAPTISTAAAVDSFVVPPATAGAPPRPLVSAEGFARFEERAKRRRIERRTEAARTAIAERRLRDANAAIDEIRQLDPEAPEIAGLIAEAATARRAKRIRSVRRWQVGPYLAAAAAFASILFAASLVEQPHSLLSYPMSIISALVATAEPAPLNATSETPLPEPTGTSGDTVRVYDRAAQPRTPETMTMRPAPPVVSVAESSVSPAATTPTPMPQPASSTVSPAVMPGSTTAVAPPVTQPAPPVVPAAMPPQPVRADAPAEESVVEPRVADDNQVRRALLQYKNAYEALDARSAQAVWPVVNERALARAFDGLESQHLIFDSCQVQVNGDAASAICRGTARYVAKVGSHEPRTEPRVWNFTLRRRGADWKIESARAER